MTTLRDDLIDCLRIARLGHALPKDSVYREHAGREADNLIRLLSKRGYELVQTGKPQSNERPDSLVIWRSKLHGREAERLIRAGDHKWQLLTIEAEKETVEIEFTLHEVFQECGLVLTDAPEARQIAGLGRKLAAVAEIFRMNAEGMA